MKLRNVRVIEDLWDRPALDIKQADDVHQERAGLQHNVLLLTQTLSSPRYRKDHMWGH